MSKHTQGEWSWAARVCGGGDIEIASGGNPAGVAELATIHASSEYTGTLPAEANARLMTAAPLLLAALIEARANLSDERLGLAGYTSMVGRLDAAIEAAGGGDE